MTDEKLNKLIAEKIIGWKRSTIRVGKATNDDIIEWEVEGLRFGEEYFYAFNNAEQPRNTKGLPDYSTSIIEAWKVIEKMRDKGFVTIVVQGVATSLVQMYDANGTKVCVDQINSIPRQICIAALTVIGEDV
jgi:hypothetical protein